MRRLTLAIAALALGLVSFMPDRTEVLTSSIWQFKDDGHYTERLVVRYDVPGALRGEIPRVATRIEWVHGFVPGGKLRRPIAANSFENDSAAGTCGAETDDVSGLPMDFDNDNRDCDCETAANCNGGSPRPLTIPDGAQVAEVGPEDGTSGNDTAEWNVNWASDFNGDGTADNETFWFRFCWQIVATDTAGTAWEAWFKSPGAGSAGEIQLKEDAAPIEIRITSGGGVASGGTTTITEDAWVSVILKLREPTSTLSELWLNNDTTTASNESSTSSATQTVTNYRFLVVAACDPCRQWADKLDVWASDPVTKPAC